MEKEYIEREAVQAKLERLRDKCGNDEMTFALNWALDLILKIPSADVVEIVRCKDCKYYREEPSQHVDDAVVVWCDAGHYPTSKVMPDDWFCAGGQRRE